MRLRLLISTVLVLVAAPVAIAQEPSTPGQACTPEAVEEHAIEAMREALEDPLPPRAGRVVKVRLTPCAPGRLVLRVRRATRDGVLLARGDRTLATTGTATVQLRTTKAVERYRGKRLRLHLSATFTP